MITRNDVIRLLALAARGDLRNAGADDVDDWYAIARMQRWSAPAAARVILEYRSVGADRPRITPAAISDRLKALRGRAAESFEAPVIPADVEASQYPAWLREQLAQHIDAILVRWAETGAEPPAARPIPLPAVRSLPELVAAAPAHVRGEFADGVRRVAGRKP